MKDKSQNNEILIVPPYFNAESSSDQQQEINAFAATTEKPDVIQLTTNYAEGG